MRSPFGMGTPTTSLVVLCFDFHNSSKYHIIIKKMVARDDRVVDIPNYIDY